MFWKIVGGIVAFFVAVMLAVMLLATAGLAAAGAVVSSVVENLDISTVQVTDANGNTETYDVNSLESGSGRVELTGDGGERVTIDLNVPRITVQEGGDNASRVIIGDGSRFEINADGRQVRINGHRFDAFDNFDGGIFARVFTGFFRALFNLTVLTLIVVGAWLVLRSRRPAANTLKEKTPDATA